MAVDEGGRALEATKERRAHAVSAARRAARRLDEIAVEKDELAHAVFGDADAESRHRALEEEQQEQQRAHKVAAPYKKKGRILWEDL